MRFAHGNDTKIKRRPLKASVKQTIEGHRDNKNIQHLNHDWLNDKQIRFEYIP